MLTLLGLLLYAQTLPCPFLWDEYGVILDNAAKGAFDWENLPSLFRYRYFHIPGSPELRVQMPYYRPLTVLFHALSHHAFGGSAWGYRLASLLLHVGNALLLFILFSTLLSDPSRGPNGSSVALAATFLFFVHPRNVESVCIIANQTGLLCAFFSLLSLCCWARLLVTERPVLSLYSASLFTLLLAMLAKESGYVVPLLHGLLAWALAPALAQARKRELAWLLSGFFLLIAVPLLLRHFWLEGPSIGTVFLREFAKQDSLLAYLGSVLALLLHQLDQWFFPVSVQLFQYPFRPEGLTLREVGLPLLCCSALVWGLRRDRRLLAFGFGLFLIAYLPSSNLVPMGRLPGGGLKTGAHHLYLPQAGLVLLAASALFAPGGKVAGPGGTGRNRLISWSLTAILVLLLCHQTIRFAGAYQSADRFYRGVLERNPVYSGAWQNYAWYKLYLKNEPDDAERILLEGLEVMVSEEDSRGERKLVWNLLHLYLRTKRVDEAATLLRCMEEEWLQDPVGNRYYWTLVRRLEEKSRDQGSGIRGQAPHQDHRSSSSSSSSSNSGTGTGGERHQ